MSVIATLEPMLIQGFKNGMSFKQVRDRMPGLAARKLNITEKQFHAQLEIEFGRTNNVMDALAARVVSQFTVAEQQAIGRRK